jgi:hypothetical protein
MRQSVQHAGSESIATTGGIDYLINADDRNIKPLIAGVNLCTLFATCNDER